MLKSAMQQMKDLRANPSTKKENSQMQNELGSKMKDLVARIKQGATLVSSANNSSNQNDSPSKVMIQRHIRARP